MKLQKLTLLLGLVILGGCSSSEPSTFGVRVAYRGTSTNALSGTMCLLADNVSGGEAVELRRPQGTDTPSLWLEVHDDGGDAPYELEAYEVTAFKPGTHVPTSKRTLVRRSYDRAFGTGAKQDSITFTYEGEDLTVDVLGVPKDRSCGEQMPRG